MSNKIDAYLWAFKNVESGIKSVSSLKKFYPNSSIYINVDFEGDFANYSLRGKEIGARVTKNNFQLGYCGDFGNVIVGRDCWDRESTFEWFRGFYEACLKSDAKYMLLLEEDDFILKPISILEQDFSIAIHPTSPSPTGRFRANFIPDQFKKYSAKHNGISTCPGYASGGGSIINRKDFIKAWEYCKDFLYNDYDSLKEINKIIGWIDFSLQYVMMLGGYEVIQNFELCEHWEVPNNWDQFEIVTGLKDHNLITL